MIHTTRSGITPSQSQPKYRKTLNQNQLGVLRLLHRFRFACSVHVAKYSNKQSVKDIQKRLKILEEQGLIAKRYDKTYKLRGKPAAYYLTPKGARVLEIAGNRAADEPINIKRLYKERSVSEDFIRHCLNVLEVYLLLIALHPTKGILRFVTKNSLLYEKYDFFPNPRQDAYIQLSINKPNEWSFFLDIYETKEPFFVLVRRIKKYVSYIAEDSWRSFCRDLPTILLIVEDKRVHKRLQRRITKELRDSYHELRFATTTLDMLSTPELKGKVWYLVDNAHGVVTRSIEPATLVELATHRG